MQPRQQQVFAMGMRGGVQATACARYTGWGQAVLLQNLNRVCGTPTQHATVSSSNCAAETKQVTPMRVILPHSPFNAPPTGFPSLLAMRCLEYDDNRKHQKGAWLLMQLLGPAVLDYRAMRPVSAYAGLLSVMTKAFGCTKISGHVQSRWVARCQQH